MSSEQPNLDIGALMAQLGQVQQNLQEAQASVAAQVVRGTAGGGKVTVDVSGDLDFRQVTIDPSVVDPGEVELLQDLVLAAVRAAADRARELQEQSMGGLGGGLQGLLGQ